MLVLLALCGACNDDDTGSGAPARVTTVGVTEIWASQVTAVGAVETLDGISVAERGFIYGKAGEFDAVSGERVVAELTDESRFSATIAGLDPQTEYRLAAYVRDHGGCETVGTPVDFSTGEMTTARISSSAVVSVTAKTAVLSARMVDDGGVPADLFGVEFRGEAASGAELYTIDGAPNYMVRSGGEFVVSVPVEAGLSPGTRYLARMYARSNGVDAYTAEFTLQMLDIELPRVETPKALDGDAGMTDLTLTARLVSDGNDPAATFGVAYKQDAASGELPDDSWVRVAAAGVQEDGVSYTVHVTGLTASSSYGLAAYAVNDAGTDYGEVLQVQTQQLVSPQTVARMYGANEFDALFDGTTDYHVGADYIYMQADIVETGGHNFTRCGFLLATDPAFTDAAEVEATTVGEDRFWAKSTGLASGTRYYYKSFVETESGERFESDIVASVSTAAIYAQDGISRLYLLKMSQPGGKGTAVTLGPDQNVPLFYYELPPVEVEVSGQKYNYYFLDRNLGSSRAPTPDLLNVTEFSSAITDVVGYFFQLGREVPSASSDAYLYAASGGLASLATDKYGWNDKNSNTTWADSANPCPKGYRVPSKEEFDHYVAALGNDIPTVRKQLNACVTGIRAAGNGGIASGNNRNRICFYLTTGIYDLYDNNLNFIVNAAQGAPVRCIRVEPK